MAVLWLSAEDTVDPTGPFTDSAIRSASWILYKLTAEKYPGIQTTTEVYSMTSQGTLEFMPQIVNGEMINTTGRHVSGNDRLVLRGSPIVSVSEVTVDGQIVPFSDFWISNNTSLVRRDRKPWLLSDLSEVSVTYSFGSPPPAMGVRAAIRLANELIWSEKEPENCSLPERVTSVQRQGISYTVLDPQPYISEGKTGIYEIDLFIHSANPIKAKKKPRIFSGTRPSGEVRR